MMMVLSVAVPAHMVGAAVPEHVLDSVHTDTRVLSTALLDHLAFHYRTPARVVSSAGGLWGRPTVQAVLCKTEHVLIPLNLGSMHWVAMHT